MSDEIWAKENAANVTARAVMLAQDHRTKAALAAYEILMQLTALARYPWVARKLQRAIVHMSDSVGRLPCGGVWCKKDGAEVWVSKPRPTATG